ncbi:CRISPR-associated helicase Cas3' [Streptomyces cinerochromogenes]|uniref:CRISPR-associated helicase Cas3' n=1 Tax=Streptomyces cinerochromogenes TaxID=66422 RepID=UPI0036C54F85
MGLPGLDESAWGKSRGLERDCPPYPLVRHLLDAAAMAAYLWDVYLSENQRRAVADGLHSSVEQARGVVALCAGLHDIGKISGFQFCSRHGRDHLSAAFLADVGKIGVERVGHDVAGMQAASAVLEALGFKDAGEGAAVRRIAEIIGGHHGRFHRNDYRRNAQWAVQERLGGRAWAVQRELHAQAVHRLLGEVKVPDAFDAGAAVLVTGVVILADWLVSQAEYVRGRQQALEGSLAAHFHRSQADAPALLRQAGLEPVELVYQGFSQSYGIDGDPNPLQRSVMDELPAAAKGGRKGGIMLVTAAPGDGKSETALEAVRVLSQVFDTRGYAFVLPTMATSDQMYGRVAASLRRQAAGGAGLTLLHSMAWLNAAYADEDLQGGDGILVCDGDEGPGAARSEADSRPRRWLRGMKRALLAQFAVGTVDQALMSVLPVRHNALRLLGLSGKAFVVDEAHAYDPYMQVLLGRLLSWLGTFGVPVVLLSATLPVSVSDRLIKEYLRGAGIKRSELKKRQFRAPYPGWLYVDADTGACTPMSPVRQREQAAVRSMDLEVQVEPVAHGATAGARGRLAVIERLLEPVAVGEGGCALVVCNTVGEAQQTYLRLRERYSSLAGEELLLVHARFPGDVREERTAQVTGGMGRSGPRPARRIVVATQVVEQSLDLDADLVVSDLAPLALLLQRAGRCWRHENWWSVHGYPGGRGRPGWAGAPRLVVLDPLAGGGKVPVQWGEVYAEHLLIETAGVMAGLDGAAIAVPGDVQQLVERVHGDRDDRFDWDDPAKSAAFSAYRGGEMAARGMADVVVVPRARSLWELHEMHHLEGAEDEWEAATRLGADSVRLLCVHQQSDGRITLDAAGQEDVPAVDAEPTACDVRRVMRRTIPVRADWFTGAEADAHRPPPSWAEHPMLGEIRILCQPVVNGLAQAVPVGAKTLRLDTELGLVRQ